MDVKDRIGPPQPETTTGFPPTDQPSAPDQQGQPIPAMPAIPASPGAGCGPQYGPPAYAPPPERANRLVAFWNKGVWPKVVLPLGILAVALVLLQIATGNVAEPAGPPPPDGTLRQRTV